MQAHDFVRAKDSPRISAARTRASIAAREKYRRQAAERGISAMRTPSSGSRLGTRARDAVLKINETKEKATIIWKPRRPSRWMMHHRPAVSSDPRANAERARLDIRLQSERDAFVGKQAERLAEFEKENIDD